MLQLWSHLNCRKNSPVHHSKVCLILYCSLGSTVGKRLKLELCKHHALDGFPLLSYPTHGSALPLKGPVAIHRRNRFIQANK